MPRLTIHIDGRPEPIFVYLDETCETVQIDFEGVPVFGLTGRNDGGVTVGHWTEGDEWVPLMELDRCYDPERDDFDTDTDTGDAYEELKTP